MIKKRLLFDVDIKKDEFIKIKKAYELMLKEIEDGVSGYYELPINQEDVVNQIYDFISSNRYLSHNLIKDLVVIGIGGSSLGTRAIDTLLKFSSNRNIINVHFLENLDPLYLQNSIKNIDLERAFIVLISKSGTTIETISIAKYIFSLIKDPIRGLDIKDKIAIVTDEDSPLDKLSKERTWKTFYIPKNVGGRFSVLSPVGLLPLAILGHNIKELLNGANMMREEFLKYGPELLMFKKAYYYYKNRKEKNINILFSYSSMFEAFNKWYIQLWGESLGKKRKDNKRVGLTPIGLIGSIDQHSFLQLIVDGPQDKSVTFLKLKNFELPITIPHISLPYLETTDFVNGRRFQTIINTQCDATIESIVEAGVPVDLIEINELSEKSSGYLIYYFELLTSAIGVMLGINSYDQPGVERGKAILKNRLSK